MINKNISNKKMIDSLQESLRLNSNAQDYVQNEINRLRDILKYNDKDYLSKENLSNLEYINFTLKYLEDSYEKALKGLI